MSQIKRAFLTLSREVHPDKFGDFSNGPDVIRASSMVNNAGDILKNFELKQLYDQSPTTEVFKQRMQAYEAEQGRRSQAAADEEARRDAEQKAAQARAAAEVARKVEEEIAREESAGFLPREVWYRAPRRQEVSDATKRRREAEGPGRKQTNAAGVMDSNKTRAKQALKQARAKSFYEARSGQDALAYFASRAQQAQQAVIDSFNIGSDPVSLRPNGRLTLSEQHFSERGNYRRFGKLTNEQRKTRQNAIAAKKAARQEVVQIARNTPPPMTFAAS